MIEVKNIEKSFEGKKVLKGISLSISEGENMVILGPSGQGKTVFLRHIARLLIPDKGEVYIDGVEITRIPERKLTPIRKKMAFVFQNSALFDFLTVEENIGLYLTMHTKLKQYEIKEKVREALEFVGLEGTETLYPEELSGGMRKRAAIARALIVEPKYVLYDEPTTGLDRRNAAVVSSLINLLKDRLNATSVIVTHDIELMREVADRVALLKEGSIIWVGEKENVTEDMLRELYSDEGGFYDL